MLRNLTKKLLVLGVEDRERILICCSHIRNLSRSKIFANQQLCVTSGATIKES